MSRLFPNTFMRNHFLHNRVQLRLLYLYRSSMGRQRKSVAHQTWHNVTYMHIYLIRKTNRQVIALFGTLQSSSGSLSRSLLTVTQHYRRMSLHVRKRAKTGLGILELLSQVIGSSCFWRFSGLGCSVGCFCRNDNKEQIGKNSNKI